MISLRSIIRMNYNYDIQKILIGAYEKIMFFQLAKIENFAPT